MSVRIKTKRVSEDTNRQIDEMLIDGVPKREIANRLGIDSGVVYNRSRQINSGQKANKNDADKSENQIVAVEEEKEVIAKSEEVEEVVNKEQSKYAKRISEELQLQMAIAYDDGMTMGEVASKYGVAFNTASNYIKKLSTRYQKENVDKSKKSTVKSKTTKTKRSKTIVEESAKSRIVPLENSIKVEMFSGRHDTSEADLAIFPGALDKKYLFDFKYQQETIKRFLQNNVLMNPKRPSIKFYVSGFQSTLAILIKLCGEMKINLTLYHYSDIAKRNIPQVIYGTYSSAKVPYKLRTLMNGYSQAFIYGSSVSNLMKCEEIYAVCKINAGSKEESDSDLLNNSSERSLYLTSTEDLGWELYRKIVSEISKSDNLEAVFLRKIKNEEFFMKMNMQPITKSYNFK